MEERLVQLEAEEEAGLLERPPATDGGDGDKTREREGVREYRRSPQAERSRENGPSRDDGRDRKEGEARERELRIARNEIVAQPVGQIPYEGYVGLYRESAERYGFGGDWYVLAAVGKIESNHGENMGPSGAGAMGPMQFLPSTWSSYGVDGDGDGEANIMDPEDAIPAAAAYLKAGGAPEDWYAALFTYNRAGWYVEEVLAMAESYRRIHGDDTVGPYMEPQPAPSVEAPPGPKPTTQQEDVSGAEQGPEDVPGVGEGPTGERTSEEATPPPDKELKPPDDAPDTDAETDPEPEESTTGGEATTERYQY